MFDLYSCSARYIELRLISACFFSAEVLYLPYETMPIAESIPMSATTTKSSINVKPRL